jgi:hypothetical protein
MLAICVALFNQAVRHQRDPVLRAANLSMTCSAGANMLALKAVHRIGVTNLVFTFIIRG